MSQTHNKNKPINAVYKNTLIALIIRNYETHKYSLCQNAYSFIGTDRTYNNG